MRSLKIFGVALVLTIISTFCTQADESPFSAKIDAGGLWIHTKSHMEAGDDNKRINSFTESPRGESEFIPFPSFELNYLAAEEIRLYASIPKPTLGIEWSTETAGKFNLSLFYDFPGDVWEDPYLLGVDRKETDQNRYGFKLAWEAFNLKLNYELSLLDVDNDVVGDRLPDLRRNGEIHAFNAAYEIQLGEGLVLVPAIDLTLGNIEGRSNEYKGIGGGLTLMKMWGELMLMASVDIGKNDYDSVHPVFGITRKDDSLKTMAMLSWENPLGYEKWAVNMGMEYEKIDSDITFFDSSSSISFVTIGYRFGDSGHGNGKNGD